MNCDKICLAFHCFKIICTKFYILIVIVGFRDTVIKFVFLACCVRLNVLESQVVRVSSKLYVGWVKCEALTAVTVRNIVFQSVTLCRLEEISVVSASLPRVSYPSVSRLFAVSCARRFGNAY